MYSVYGYQGCRYSAGPDHPPELECLNVQVFEGEPVSLGSIQALSICTSWTSGSC